MKTAQEIFDEHNQVGALPFNEVVEVYYPNAIAAMEAYASQFRPSSETIKAAMEKGNAFGEIVDWDEWVEYRDRIAGELSGSGVNLPLNLTIWKKAQSMNYSDFAKWFNEELKNNTPPTK